MFPACGEVVTQVEAGRQTLHRVNVPGKDTKRGKRGKSLRELSCYSGPSKGILHIITAHGSTNTQLTLSLTTVDMVLQCFAGLTLGVRLTLRLYTVIFSTEMDDPLCI